MQIGRWMVGAAVVLSGVLNVAAEQVEADIDGAVPGKWTMDFEAAKKVAAEKKLPIMLDFSGTDWCGWCKLMEEQVFTKPEWGEYAKGNLMMVLVDFPSDKGLVPEKYVERNKALKAKYGITGFPTFVILDDDGATELGRLQAGRGKTPASFQGELKGLFARRPGVIDAYCASLGEEKAKIYRAMLAELDAKKAASEAAAQAAVEAQNRANSAKGAIVNYEKEITAFRVAQLSDEKRAEYARLETQLEDAKARLTEWLKTKPEQNEANMEKYAEQQRAIKTIEQQLSEF